MSRTPLGRSASHDSAVLHVTGQATYVDDIPPPRGMLVVFPVTSPVARGRIVRRDAADATDVPGVHAVLFAEDIPGENAIGPILHDEQVLATDAVHSTGQVIALVVGETRAACREAAGRVIVEIEPLEPTLTIQAALAAESWHGEHHIIERGDVGAAVAGAAVVVRGEVSSGAQDHFYLETHAALVEPLERGCWRVRSSTQHPTEVQVLVALALGIPRNRVVVEVPRMGGAFGGKESQAAHLAVYAALAAVATGRPVRCWFDRDQDMCMTGKRHPFWSRYEAAFDDEGSLLAFDVLTVADGGWSSDLSAAILDRALFHLDNAYYVPNLRFEGRVAKTNLPSNTAFRGFGGPQGMLVVEDALERAAEALEIDPAELRRRNFYGPAPRNLAPYGMEVRDCRLDRLWDDLVPEAQYEARRGAIEANNAASAFVKRGIGLQPVKFGISFTNSTLNQAGALVLVFADGSVQLNHGGTEMGQGLHTKMVAICAHELGVPVASVRIMDTATDKVPNTSATAASSGSDLNGQAVRAACVQIRERMAEVAGEMLGQGPDTVVFEAGVVRSASGAEVPFADLARRCWFEQVSLAASGFYATPGLAYDRRAGQGRPFHYYAYGMAICEVELNALTGEHRVVRVDILHDVGDPLVPSIDVGQVEGGFVQGLGWLTCEEVIYDDRGVLITHGPSTYKIPAIGDVPIDLRVRLLERARQPNTIHGSKAVGEPPFMLAISVISALRHAIAGCGPGRVELAIPATPEAILRAVEAQRHRDARRGAAK